MRARRVRALLMGGQACVFYGAAEFSRDIDFVILADAKNLARLRAALTDLKANPIAVPPSNIKYLRRGFAIHYRCQHPEAFRLRVDVMSKMRGVDTFAKLWRRRVVIALPDGTKCDLLSLEDLVQAKKTQRDKDWPMIRRLLEAHYFQHQKKSTLAQRKFWLLEMRTPAVLVDIARQNPRLSRQLQSKRPVLTHAVAGNVAEVEKLLVAEEVSERERDKAYWLPLRRELERLRHKK